MSTINTSEAMNSIELDDFDDDSDEPIIGLCFFCDQQKEPRTTRSRTGATTAGSGRVDWTSSTCAIPQRDVES